MASLFSYRSLLIYHVIVIFARVVEERKVTRFWWEIPKERDHSEDQGVKAGSHGVECTTNNGFVVSSTK
jgi:hypothetical protein